MNTNRDTGAWLVAVYKVLSQFSTDEPALDPLEAVIKAGRAAELFSAVRAAGRIDANKFEIHRKLAKIRPSDAREIIEIAEDQGYVDITWSAETPRAVTSLEFRINSNDSVLEAAGALFKRLDPTPIALAVIQILQCTLPMPKTQDTVRNEMSALNEKTVKDALELAAALGLVSFTDGTQGGSPLVFNPYVFEGDAVDALKTLEALNPTERQQAQDIVNHVYSSPGVPLPKGTDAKIAKVLIQVGVIDYSKITTTNTSKGVYFPTAPNAWGVLAKTSGGGPELSQDLVDDAKLFVNSLRYGEYYSTSKRGKIFSPYLIVNALLRDGAIGTQRPATAIGEDYPLAWSRGIINVVESRIYPGRYSMELLKRDVASAVKDVISTQKILPEPDVPSPEAVERAGKFVSPGAVRIEKELPPALKHYHDELIFGLRIMRKKR